MIGYIWRYLSNREEGFIERWHAWPTLRRESVAEHQFFVARNALFISRLLWQYKIAKPDQAKVVELAMVHDATERFIGDISGIAKREYPQLKETLDDIEKDIIHNHLYRELGPLAKKYQDAALMAMDKNFLESQIVKYADLLDAHMFARTEVGIGNKSMDVHVARTQDFMSVLSWPWLQKLREETGLP